MNHTALIDGHCGWAGKDPLYVEYHDMEWGRPVSDDRKLFESLVLESAQAGLSWISILRRRDGYRRAFHDFDVASVAAMTDEDVERLMKFDGIIRNRRKIATTITNAQHFMEIQREHGSFHNYILSFFPEGKRIVNHPVNIEDIPVTSPQSDAMAKDMYRRGFRFFGSTICYAFLQATGFVDDHLEGCHCKYRH